MANNGMTLLTPNTSKYYIEYLKMNGVLLQALPGPMHLGLKTGPLCPIIY
jgi:hypothetical protein